MNTPPRYTRRLSPDARRSYRHPEAHRWQSETPDVSRLRVLRPAIRTARPFASAFLLQCLQSRGSIDRAFDAEGETHERCKPSTASGGLSDSGRAASPTRALRGLWRMPRAHRGRPLRLLRARASSMVVHILSSAMGQDRPKTRN